jgi:hypothetical protein
MRRRMIVAASTIAIVSFAGYGSASAQGVGVEVYVGPPALYYYSPGPYVQYGYAPPVYGYYEPGAVVYPRGRLRCGRYERWNGNHCVDVRTLGSSQP